MKIFAGMDENSERLQGFRNCVSYQSFPKVAQFSLLFNTVLEGWDQIIFFPMNKKLLQEGLVSIKIAAYPTLDDETSDTHLQRKTKTWYSKPSNLDRDLETYPSRNLHFAFRKCYFV